MKQLIHGDCLEALAALPKASAHALITSPPYFNARDYAEWSSYDAYLRDMDLFIRLSAKVVAPGRMMCINVSAVIQPRSNRSSRSQRFNLPGDIHALCKAAGLWFQEDLIWVKPEGAAVNRNQRFSVDRHPLQWRANPVTEHILVYQTPTSQSNDAIIKRYGGRGRVQGEFDRSEVWRINPVTSSLHSAPFPETIPARLIRYYTWPGDVVIDPFLGSGTTAIAALRAGRGYIGIERDAAYFALATDRISSAQQEVLADIRPEDLV